MHRRLTKHSIEVREFWTDLDVKINIHLDTSQFAWKETSRIWICECGENFEAYRKVRWHILSTFHVAIFIQREVFVPLKSRELTEEEKMELA